MYITSELDDSGKISLPNDYIKALKLEPQDKIDIKLLSGSILIKKHVDWCMNCFLSESVISFEEIKLCKSCIEKIKKTK